KLSWIAKVSGLSERAASYARKKLISMGWLSPDTGSTQWKLNRHGAYFAINLDWLPSGKKRKIAPRTPGKEPVFAPPIEDKKTPNGSKNQKNFGVFKKGEGEKLSSPSLWKVAPDDLHSLARCE